MPEQPAQAAPIAGLTIEERKAKLVAGLQLAASRGWRIESQGDLMAVIFVKGHVSHVLWFLGGLFWLLVWAPICVLVWVAWAVMIFTRRDLRRVLTVDESGKINEQATK